MTITLPWSAFLTIAWIFGMVVIWFYMAALRGFKNRYAYLDKGCLLEAFAISCIWPVCVIATIVRLLMYLIASLFEFVGVGPWGLRDD